MDIILCLVIIILFLFAIYKEKKEQKNAYTDWQGKNDDNIKSILTKIETSYSSTERLILWRRSFIFSVIATAIIFLLIHGRFPQSNEIIMYILFIFIIYYTFWQNMIQEIYIPIKRNGRENIRKLKQKLLSLKKL